MTARTVSVIGSGAIGRAVIDHIRNTPGLRLGRVLSRSGSVDTNDLDRFLAGRADLIIDAAGPNALAAHGARCLAVADLWSVGAAALADAGLLVRMETAARDAGTRLRLFSPWAYGIDAAPRASIQSLKLRVVRHGITPWRGALKEAADLFPGEVNFAVAAALNGPGIDRTELVLEPTSDPALHRIDTECVTEAGVVAASIRFSSTGRHPTALCLIAALEQLTARIG